jgi:homoserine kinase
VTAAVRVTCPATSANLGPGFDALGLALGLTNVFRVAPGGPGVRITARGAEGTGAERLPPGEENLVVRAFGAAREALGLAPVAGLDVDMELSVPAGRGLGSSATAVVAGVLAASALSAAEGGPALDLDGAIDLAARLEGHPDNVVPCLRGGVCAARRRVDGRVVHARAAPARLPAVVVAIPLALEKSTEAMRRRLPAQVPFADAVETVGRLALLLFALLGEAPDLLDEALDDRLHQPARGPMIPGWEAVRAAGRAAGAHGVVISGAGPTLLALAPDARAEAVAAAMTAAWAGAGVAARVARVPVDTAGARVELV